MNRSCFNLLISVLLFSLYVPASVFQSAPKVDAVPANVALNLNQLLPSSREVFIYNHYYEIKNESRSTIVDLMHLVHHKKNFPLPKIAYDRREQFGPWVSPKDDGTCLNIRGLVMVRDSDGPVTYTPDGCSVQSGAWKDPYTAKTFKSADDIQVDHFVPLKNAYMTGAHEWDANKRCLYANYMGNNFHLLAVNATENMSKGGSTPLEYIPPNRRYVCQYLKQWLAVKAIWNLRLTPPEAQAIQNVAIDNNCRRDYFQISAVELSEQRRYMRANQNLCNRN